MREDGGVRTQDEDDAFSWFECPCGKRHLLPEQPLLRFTTELGPDVTVTTPSGSWQVPRVWIAAHGLKEAELPALAAEHGWPEAR